MPDLVIDKFSGINNQAEPEDLEPGEFTAALNVDVDDKLSVRGRAGHTQIDANACHSLYAMTDALYLRDGTSLVRMDPVSRTKETVDTGLVSGAHTAYASVLDRLFYSDGSTARTLRDGEGPRAWGVIPPATPSIEAIAGALPAGKYLVTATYWIGNEESGAPTPAQIELTAGGIRVTVPASTQSGVTHKAVYLSKPSGEVLYLAAVVPNDGNGVDIGAAVAGRELDGLHKTPPPPGQLLETWNGRAIVGVGSFLLYSDPFRYERFDPIRQSIPFDSAVTMFAALGRAAFVVGTENGIYRFDGDIATSTMTRIAGHGAILGASTVIDGAMAGEGAQQELLALFVSPQGLCTVGSTGGVTNLTAKRYAPPQSTRGSAAYIPSTGNHRALFALI